MTGFEAWDVKELVLETRKAGRDYTEFLRVPSMSAGVYLLGAGATDPQVPHTEDEVYYVLRGRARLTVGDQLIEAKPGTTIFVQARVPHRFHDIREPLEVLVLFAPAEGTNPQEAIPARP